MNTRTKNVISKVCLISFVICSIVFITWQVATHRNGIALWQFIVIALLAIIGSGFDTKDKTE